jgi:macrolide-specific efflux system membrane fusion protein
LAGVVLVVLAAGTGSWLLLRSPSAASATTTTATVTRGTVKQTVTASGTVEAARSADDGFAVSGTVTHVYVAAGDKVRKGQRLAAVDATSLLATRTAARSQLAAAQEQLTQDEDDDASSSQLAADRASVDSARADLTQAQQAVDDAVLRATIAGTVTDVGIAVGDTVGGTASGSDGSSGSGSTSSVISIVGGDRYVVDADLSASDVKSVRKGMQATLSVTGVSQTVYGTVSDVSLVAEAGSSGAAVYPVTIAVTGAQKDLFAGVSADATITTRVRQDVLTVDTRAVHGDSSGTYVEKVVGGRTVRTAVKLGATYGLQTEVLSGLKAGDQVEVVAFRAPSSSGSRSGSSEGGSFPGGGTFPGGTFPGGGAPGGVVGIPGGGQ